MLQNARNRRNTVTRNQYASTSEGNAIPTGTLSDFLGDLYKIRYGEGVPGP